METDWSVGPTPFGQAGKETSCTTATITVTLAVGLTESLSGMLADDTVYYDTVYYDTPARNDSRLLETAYNSIRSFARAKVNNIGEGQREVGGGAVFGALRLVSQKGRELERRTFFVGSAREEGRKNISARFCSMVR